MSVVVLIKYNVGVEKHQQHKNNLDLTILREDNHSVGYFLLMCLLNQPFP